ncbi:MAG: hypothetical protein JXB19_09375 [Bacteroidales bacterium]|nr:hypothetical protein [Bacteroidales bacterium]
MNRTRKIKHALFPIILIFSQVTSLNGQSKDHLPYSIFGIGELASKGFGRNIAMGKTGIALASDNYLNNLNPAANFLIDSISFFFDVGITGEFSNYRTNDAKQSGNDFNMNNLALGFRIAPFWSAGIGITPYSSVGYKIHSENYVVGSIDKYLVESTGSGGLNQFYWDHSIRIFKNLSLGINISYLFGNIERSERNVYNTIGSELIYTETSFFRKLFVDYGFQYRIPVNSDIHVTIGGIYGTKHKLDFRQEINIVDWDGNEIEDKLSKSGTFNFPLHYGGGISFNYAGKLTATGDYIFENWDVTAISNPYYTYTDARKFRFGVEYIPGGDRIAGYLWMIRYRAGFYRDLSYLRVDKNQITDTGFTLGVSLPFLRNRTTINVSWMTGMSGTIENGLILERYNTLHLSLELHDWWFLKAQYD